DWDREYSNGDAVPNAADYPALWQERANAFRDSLAEDRLRVIDYGSAEREKTDLFLPQGMPEGLLVFVHGGYWHKFDRRYWSWLARGALAHGWAVAITGYTLCPQARVSEISRQIRRSVSHAARYIPGPIRLAGHSAGGHLVARQICAGMLEPQTAERVGGVISISGLHDLRPLLKTTMNQILGLDESEAEHESPALLAPAFGTELTCWVGADELPEFRRQNGLLGSWAAHGIARIEISQPGRNHFTVIDDLANPESELVARALGL
ncbi:MAG: alpha/beta hydrolase, partial [Pseudomonadota bacterium]